jgi:hypothetical protein
MTIYSLFSPLVSSQPSTNHYYSPRPRVGRHRPLTSTRRVPCGLHNIRAGHQIRRCTQVANRRSNPGSVRAKTIFTLYYLCNSSNTSSRQSTTSTPEQSWYIKAPNNATSIQLASTTLCMDAGPKSGWKDMANIYLRECVAGSEQQTWNAMADGRIALAASSGTQQCVDLQYLRATQNNPVGLYNCAGLGNTGAADKGINWPLKNATVL